jgi:hypothetical protein
MDARGAFEDCLEAQGYPVLRTEWFQHRWEDGYGYYPYRTVTSRQAAP